MIALLLAAALPVAGVLLLLWVVSLSTRDVSVVDVFWGCGFVIAAWSALGAAEAPSARAWLVTLLVTAWGLRLAVYLWRRNSGKGEDFRYQAMRRATGPSFAWRSLYVVFGFQGLLVLVVSLPVFAAVGSAAPLRAVDLLGVALFAVGLTFEAVGDAQLAAFKRDPANRGRVMDRGLWAWTRHPNYFGDFCVWWGLWLLGATSAGAALGTLIGPVVMSTLLLRVSGKALLEKDIGQRRPGYAEYMRRTSGFFPRPPKRASGAG